MDSLIAKLEAAAEGSRELDAEIALCIGFEGNSFDGPLAEAMAKYPEEHATIANLKGIPHYTTSLDAALVLVPAEFQKHWSVCEKYGECGAMLGDLSRGFAANFKGHTAPLALCIASLKARKAGGA